LHSPRNKNAQQVRFGDAVRAMWNLPTSMSKAADRSVRPTQETKL